MLWFEWHPTAKGNTLYRMSYIEETTKNTYSHDISEIGRS